MLKYDENGKLDWRQFFVDGDSYVVRVKEYPAGAVVWEDQGILIFLPTMGPNVPDITKPTLELLEARPWPSDR